MNLNLRSVQSKITLGFGLILLVVAVLSFAIVSGIRTTSSSAEKVPLNESVVADKRNVATTNRKKPARTLTPTISS